MRYIQMIVTMNVAIVASPTISWTAFERPDRIAELVVAEVAERGTSSASWRRRAVRIVVAIVPIATIAVSDRSPRPTARRPGAAR